MDEPTTLEAAFGKIRLQINSTIAPVRRPSQLLLAIDSTLKNQDDESLSPTELAEKKLREMLNGF